MKAHQLLTLLLSEYFLFLPGLDAGAAPVPSLCKLAQALWSGQALACAVLLGCVVEHAPVCACSHAQHILNVAKQDPRHCAVKKTTI